MSCSLAVFGLVLVLFLRLVALVGVVAAVCPRAQVRTERIEGNTIYIEIERDHTISFKVPEDFFYVIDEEYKKRGFKSRSDFIRKLIEVAFENNYKPSNLEDGHPSMNSKPLTKTISMRASDRVLHMIKEMMERYGLETKSDLLRVLVYDVIRGKLPL